MGVMKMLKRESLVINGGTIEAFFGKVIPEQYSTTGTKYASVNLADFLQKRNMDIGALGSLTSCLPEGAVIAGGSVMSAMDKTHQSSDIDIFFTDGEAFLNTYDLLLNPPDATDAWAWRGYKTETNRADLLTHSREIRTVNFTSDNPERRPIQLIKMVWFNDSSDVIDSFDFTVCQFSLTKDELIFNPVSFVDLHNKELISHRWQAPVSIIYRIIKYVKKGYKMSNRTVVSACEGIRDAEKIQPEEYPIGSYSDI
jgi:hypothetical protein